MHLQKPSTSFRTLFHCVLHNRGWEIILSACSTSSFLSSCASLWSSHCSHLCCSLPLLNHVNIAGIGGTWPCLCLLSNWWYWPSIYHNASDKVCTNWWPIPLSSSTTFSSNNNEQTSLNNICLLLCTGSCRCLAFLVFTGHLFKKICQSILLISFNSSRSKYSNQN